MREIGYANTDPSLHANHSEPKEHVDWRRVYNYCLQVFDYDAAELVKIQNMISDECSDGDHDLCNFAWCSCDHHSVNQFHKKHPGLRSLVHTQIGREEAA